MVNIIVALPGEAKALREALRLRPVAVPAGFSAYQGEEATLVVGGVGKVAAAGAVMLAAQLNGERPAAGWLNVGVAGHRDSAVGTAFWVNKVTDAATGQCWFPPSLWPVPLPRKALCTVPVPRQQAGEEDELYDMEASAFMEMATRFTTGELVHCCKIVSDHLHDAAGRVQAGDVERLVTARLEAIMALFEAVHRAGCWWRAEQDLPREPLLERFHFSRSQRHRLEKLLRRWRALRGDQAVTEAVIGRCRNAAQVLARLEACLAELPVRL